MKNNPEIPKRNGSLYPSRHDAYLAYKKLRPYPIWFEDDGIKAYIVVDFHDWIWLPVRENNRYLKEDKKFLEGENTDDE